MTPHFQLTPAEIRLIQNYRQLREEAQRSIYGIVDDCSKSDLQRKRELKRPALRLVPGGVQ